MLRKRMKPKQSTKAITSWIRKREGWQVCWNWAHKSRRKTRLRKEWTKWRRWDSRPYCRVRNSVLISFQKGRARGDLMLEERHRLKVACSAAGTFKTTSRGILFAPNPQRRRKSQTTSTLTTVKRCTSQKLNSSSLHCWGSLLLPSICAHLAKMKRLLILISPIECSLNANPTTDTIGAQFALRFARRRGIWKLVGKSSNERKRSSCLRTAALIAQVPQNSNCTLATFPKIWASTYLHFLITLIYSSIR